jgi:hypothetical protein
MADHGSPLQLSIVIPCRDAEDVLGVQLGALARQHCPVPWEVLVCDNGSGDGTVALAKRWAGRLPLRIVVADALPGAGPARNAGVGAARGAWIGFCDADDEVADDWLASLCAALQEHPFVAGRFDGERLNSARTLRSRSLDQQVGLQRSSPTVGLAHAGGGNLGIHRSVFMEIGGFDPAVRYLQDTDLCWRVQLAGYPLVFIPDLVVHVRLRATLRGMYQQGRNYGSSLASLERRYAGIAERRDLSAMPVAMAAVSFSNHGSGQAAEAAAAGGALPGVDQDAYLYDGGGRAVVPARDGAVTRKLVKQVRAGRRAARGAVRLARFFASNKSSLGAQAWQIGWHVGHRS